MKDINSRRNFLRNSIVVAAGFAISPKTVVANNLTDVSGKLGNSDVFKVVDLRKSKLFGKHVTIKGKIYNSEGTSPLANVNLDVWHFSPGSKIRKHKATLKTNSLGEYIFKTDFPEKLNGKSPRVHFKVSKGAKEYGTELIINHTGANISEKHWTENKQLGNKLFPSKEDFLNSSTITFNISI